MDQVILVDHQDNEIGVMEKLEAHRKGALHRAFSLLVFNSKGELLLQKRASTKYHSGGLWTNTCCSHPLPGESMKDATARKLKQEMGIVVPLEFAFAFVYQIQLGEDLTEHEYDHVFTGTFDGLPLKNSEEVDDWKFVNLEALKEDVSRNPASYTYWFKLILEHPLFIGNRYI